MLATAPLPVYVQTETSVDVESVSGEVSLSEGKGKVSGGVDVLDVGDLESADSSGLHSPLCSSPVLDIFGMCH